MHTHAIRANLGSATLKQYINLLAKDQLHNSCCSYNIYIKANYPTYVLLRFPMLFFVSTLFISVSGKSPLPMLQLNYMKYIKYPYAKKQPVTDLLQGCQVCCLPKLIYIMK